MSMVFSARIRLRNNVHVGFKIDTNVTISYRVREEIHACRNIGYTPARLSRSPTTRSATCPRSTRRRGSPAFVGPNTVGDHSVRIALIRRRSTSVGDLTRSARQPLSVQSVRKGFLRHFRHAARVA
jgi:hypothetical protein